MTTTENRWNGPATPANDDELAVNALLAGNGLDDHDAEMLRPVLLELRGLVAGAPPVPSPDLAALLAQPDETVRTAGLAGSPAMVGAVTTGTVSDLDAHRARRRKLPGRTALTAVAVVASLGVAAGAAAAADGDFLAHTQDNIAVLLTTLTNPRPAGEPQQVPGGTTAPATGTPAPTWNESPASGQKPTAPASTTATHLAPGLDAQVPKIPAHQPETIPGLPGTPYATLPPVIPSQVPTTVPGATVVPGPGQSITGAAEPTPSAAPR